MKKLITITLILFSGLLNAQSKEDLAYSPSFTAIIVTDIEESVEWYKTIFLLEEINRFESEERGFIIVLLKKDEFTLELLELKNSIRPKEVIPDYNDKTKVQGLFKIGFKVNDFEGWIKHLKASDAKLLGDIVTDPTLNKKMVIITDPDGNRIQFFEG